MRLTKTAFLLCLFGGTILTVAGFAQVAAWGWSLTMVGLGGLWLVLSERKVRGRANAFGVLFILASVAGYYGLGLTQNLVLVAILLGLSAWDLDHYLERTAAVDGFVDESRMEIHHLQRLVLVLGIGWVAGSLALSINLQLTFGWAVILSVLVVIGLGQVIKHLRWRS